MDSEPPDASMNPRARAAIIHSVAWCDPRLCQPDATGEPGGWHYAIGEAISLTFQDDVQPVGEPQRIRPVRRRRPAR